MKYIVTGDTHGDMHRFKKYPYERDGNTAIIILGDSGVNYFLSLRDRPDEFTYLVIHKDHPQCIRITISLNEVQVIELISYY